MGRDYNRNRITNRQAASTCDERRRGNSITNQSAPYANNLPSGPRHQSPNCWKSSLSFRGYKLQLSDIIGSFERLERAVFGILHKQLYTRNHQEICSLLNLDQSGIMPLGLIILRIQFNTCISSIVHSTENSPFSFKIKVLSFYKVITERFKDVCAINKIIFAQQKLLFVKTLLIYWNIIFFSTFNINCKC